MVQEIIAAMEQLSLSVNRRSILLAATAASTLKAQNEGFTGRPLVRVDSDPNETKRTELSELAGQKYECRIDRRGRKYVWSSRGDRELIRSVAGDWTYYISPEGSGYVKVLTGVEGQPYEYIEHVTGEFKTLTYWGKRV
jgi:hypothetical protein